MTATGVTITGPLAIGGFVFANGNGFVVAGRVPTNDLSVTRLPEPLLFCERRLTSSVVNAGNAALTNGTVIGSLAIRGTHGTAGAGNAVLLRAVALHSLCAPNAHGTSLTLHGRPQQPGVARLTALACCPVPAWWASTPSTPDQQLSVNGDASKTGGASWLAFSDARSKHVFGGYTRGLDAVLALVAGALRVSNRTTPFVSCRTANTSALSLKPFRRSCRRSSSESESGYLQVNSDPILWAMLNAIKALKAENDALRARVSAIETTAREQQ